MGLEDGLARQVLQLERLEAIEVSAREQYSQAAIRAATLGDIRLAKKVGLM
jgi:hypothetical protein